MLTLLYFRHHKSPKALALLALLLSVFSSSVPLQALAWPGSNKDTAEPVAKDFLPPVALINDVLNPDQPQAESIGPTSLEPVALNMTSTTPTAAALPAVKLTPRLKSLTGSISVHKNDEMMQAIIDLQQQLDDIDLKKLWEATVERNPVIRFSLEKLNTPVDLQPKKSSQFLNKTISTMFNTAAMGVMMLPGANAYQNMAAMSASQAAQNVLLGNNKPQVEALSPTEQIQLAGLIEDLKGELIQNYHNYKKSLELLAQAHEVSLRNNNLYAKALGTKNELAMMAAASAFYKAMLNETDLRRKTMLYRLRLERLAGHDVVSDLKLALFVTPTNPTDQPTTQANQPTTPSHMAAVEPRPEPEQPVTSHNARNSQPTAEFHPTEGLKPPEGLKPIDSLKDADIGPPVPSAETPGNALAPSMPSGLEPSATPNQEVGPPTPPSAPEEIL